MGDKKAIDDAAKRAMSEGNVPNVTTRTRGPLADLEKAIDGADLKRVKAEFSGRGHETNDVAIHGAVQDAAKANKSGADGA